MRALLFAGMMAAALLITGCGNAIQAEIDAAGKMTDCAALKNGHAKAAVAAKAAQDKGDSYGQANNADIMAAYEKRMAELGCK